MAVPKRKHSNARTGSRRAHHAKKPRQLEYCHQVQHGDPFARHLPQLRPLRRPNHRRTDGIIRGQSVSASPAQGEATDRHVGQVASAWAKAESARAVSDGRAGEARPRMPGLLAMDSVAVPPRADCQMFRPCRAATGR